MTEKFSSLGEEFQAEEESKKPRGNVDVDEVRSGMGVTEETAAEKFGKFLKNNLVIFVLTFILIAVIGVNNNAETQREAEQRIQNAEIHKLKQKIDATQNNINKEYNTVIRGVTGVDVTRKGADDNLMREVMQKATSWGNMREYLDARESIMRKYNISPDSQFMTEFMPGEGQGVRTVDGAGEVYYGTNPNVAMEFDNFKSSVVSIEGPLYTYFGMVTSTTKSKDGSAMDTNYSLIEYTVDGNKHIGDIRAYPSAQSVQKSQ